VQCCEGCQYKSVSSFTQYNFFSSGESFPHPCFIAQILAVFRTAIFRRKPAFLLGKHAFIKTYTTSESLHLSVTNPRQFSRYSLISFFYFSIHKFGLY